MKTEYLLEKEVQRVLAALMPENRLAMRVVLHTGLRISDVLSLKPDKLAPIVYVTEQKTGKRRRVGLPRPLLEDLTTCSNAWWVFPSPKDPKKHRTRQAVWADLKRAEKLFRLPQNIGTHSGRKVYAVRLREKYKDIEHVQRILKHKYKSVTEIYALADLLLEQKYHARKLRGRDA